MNTLAEKSKKEKTLGKIREGAEKELTCLIF